MEWLTAHDMRALILDLRDNPGGLLTSAAEVCDMFIDKGVIVTTKGREGQVRRVDRQRQGPVHRLPYGDPRQSGQPSASEIVAACLQDHQRATIVGQRTYGKGTVQEVCDLGDDRGELKLTVASYWRPSNKNIHRRRGAGENDVWGVQPNEGYAVAVEGDELKRLYLDRLERDIFAPAPPKSRARRRPAPGRRSRWSIGSWPRRSPAWTARGRGSRPFFWPTCATACRKQCRPARRKTRSARTASLIKRLRSGLHVPYRLINGPLRRGRL